MQICDIEGRFMARGRKWVSSGVQCYHLANKNEVTTRACTKSDVPNTENRANDIAQPIRILQTKKQQHPLKFVSHKW